MVALLNARINQEELLPFLLITHPAILPVNGEPVIRRNCRILAEEEVTDIYVVLSHRPGDVEITLGDRINSARIHYIVNASEYHIENVISDLGAVLGNEFLYLTSQVVLSRSYLKSLMKDGAVKYSSVSENTPVLIDRVSSDLKTNVEDKSLRVVESLSDLYSVNNLCFDGVDDDVSPYAKVIIDNSVSIGFGTRIKNSIILHGVKTQLFESVSNALITPEHKLNLETGEICERKNRGSSISVIRVCDILLSGIGLLLLAPLFVLVAILIKADSKGPVFYSSNRLVSPEQKHEAFSMVKKRIPFTVFRTMYVNADQMIHSDDLQNKYGNGPYRKFDNDCRVTKIGAFLRKTSLDELPLLWHVFIGDLSLIGTWALPTYEAETMNDVPLVVNNTNFTDVGKARFRGTAGIAGLWQCGGRSNLPAEERAVLDAIQTAMESSSYSSKKMPNFRRSLKGYMGLIITTIKSVLGCKGAQ